MYIGDFYYNGNELSRTFSDNFFVVDGYTEPGEDQGLIRPVYRLVSKSFTY